MAIGAMVTLLCGLCTVGVVRAGFAALSLMQSHGGNGRERYDAGLNLLGLFLAPAIGGIPTSICIAILLIGLSIYRGGGPNRVGRKIRGGLMMVTGAAFAWPAGTGLYVTFSALLVPGALASAVPFALVGTAILGVAILRFFAGVRSFGKRSAEDR